MDKLNIKRRKANFIPYRKRGEELEFYLSLRSKDAKQYPDIWSFWGGGIDEGENEEEAMLREMMEELTWHPTSYKYIGIFYDSMPNEKHIYYGGVDGDFENQIKIHESQGGKFFTLIEIENEEKMIKEDKEIIIKLYTILNI